MNFLNGVVGPIISIILQIYIWRMLLDKKINKSPKLIVMYTFLMYVFIIISKFYIPSILKVLLVLIILIYGCYRLYDIQINNAISVVFSTQLLTIFSEVVFAIIYTLICNKTLGSTANIVIDQFIPDLSVFIISVIFSKTKLFKNLYSKITKIFLKLNYYNSLFIILFLISIITMYIYFSYFEINKIVLLLINILILAIYIFITFKIIEEHSNNKIIKSEYDDLLDKAVDYETIIDSQRMENHENKNDLYILRNMIPKRNKEAHAQLDDMINDYEKQTKKYKDDKDLYYQTLKIPSGGLRGLIYQKSLYMKNNNIDYSIRIDRKINSKSLNKVSRETLRNLGKIVGVYLDNAIQEVEKLDIKQIGIEIYRTGRYFNISIANNIGLKLEIDNINKTGYSTKGGKHGYGLSLVNELLTNDKNITSETSITSNIFRQNIKIKM